MTIFAGVKTRVFGCIAALLCASVFCRAGEPAPPPAPPKQPEKTVQPVKPADKAAQPPKQPEKTAQPVQPPKQPEKAAQQAQPPKAPQPAPAKVAQGPQDEFNKEIRPVLEKFCFKCHGPDKPKGGVNLAKYTSEDSIMRDPKQWQIVHRQIHELEMPPEGKPVPSPEQRDKTLAFIERTLNKLDDSKMAKDPGRKLIHRLGREEYNNTVRDLLGVDTKPADKFPADGGGGAGFDNVADALFIPPILMEKYLLAADEILQKAEPKRLFGDKAGKRISKGDAQKQLEHFAARAFRRPVEKAEIERFMTLFEASEKRGESGEEALKLVYKAVLVSPNFLFRIETDQATAEPYLISEYELASRLSYFLWSSMPDNELFKLAEQKKLRDPKILSEQVARMIKDPKSAAFADNFAGQWLGVRGLLTTVQPDGKKFPVYKPALRDALYKEAITFFHALLRDDTSLLHLLDCDYTYLNEELATHYGIAGVKGPEMRRVQLTDKARGGVLGMGSVLTLTSYPQRTSPVLRGKWVLEEILGAPTPPPPANVGLLPPDDRVKDGLTFRQRMEAHRQKPECAMCHKRMDPIGFGLENFDAIGRWRTEINKVKVDATGQLATGEKFDGAVELKALLMAQKSQFVHNLSEKMLSYALGRGLEFYDIPSVKKIAAAVTKGDYKSSVLINEVVMSYPFQYRRNAPVEASNK